LLVIKDPNVFKFIHMSLLELILNI